MRLPSLLLIAGGCALHAASEPSPMQQLGVRISASGAAPRYEAAKAIDGDPATIWHTPFGADAIKHPHWLQLEFPAPCQIRGFTVLPRRDEPRGGMICDFALFASMDGSTWGPPISRGSFKPTRELKTVLLPTPVTGRFFLLAALSGFAGAPASLAEFAVLPARDSDRSGSVLPADRTARIEIDGMSPGRVFDGIGGISAGGSTRLLIDYPEPERSQILDYLFRPNFGAALQMLKVEIGADTDTTAGAEPSHMRTPDRVDSDLGYEWWLMQEAKRRNPAIKLAALAWGAPGWVRGGFWSDDNIRYTIAWLEGAKQRGLRIDYLGGGNERGFDAEYYVKLRRALNERGYGHVKVIACEDHTPPDYWKQAAAMTKNPAFAGAVDVLGSHDICVWRTQQRHCYVSDEALRSGKPIWDSENSTQDYKFGFEPLARAMNRHYIEGRVTGNLNWSLVGAYYGSLPAPGTGLLLADRPWSGWYDLGKSVWIDAHTTQFTSPGWHYVDAACGYTPGGASYVTLRSPTGGDYSLVIETLDISAPETLAVGVTGGLSAGEVHLWSTNLRSDADADHFVHVRTIKPIAGRYSVPLEPGRLYTVSTLTGQGKGTARPRAAASQRMPLPFWEDFESTGSDRLAPFFADLHGGFEAVPAGGGRTGHAYRQMITREPVLWHGSKMPPTTAVGDPLWSGDYEVSVDALLEEPGYVELLGRLQHLSRPVAGYHFQVADTGKWKLSRDGDQPAGRVLAAGDAPPLGLKRWQRLSLRFRGDEITAAVGGREVAQVRDEAYNHGQVGLRVSAWQHAQFDNLSVVPTAPAPKFIPHAEMTASATSEHPENDFGLIYIARNAIDDRVETSWRSEYVPPAPLPQSLTLDLGVVRSISGLVYDPPTGDGAIIRYRVETSRDGKTFREVASGDWKPTLATKTVTWTEAEARFVRLEAIAATGNRGASIREINIIER